MGEGVGEGREERAREGINFNVKCPDKIIMQINT